MARIFDDRSFAATAKAVVKYNPHRKHFTPEEVEAEMRRVSEGYSESYVATCGFCLSYGVWDDGTIYIKATLDVACLDMPD